MLTAFVAGCGKLPLPLSFLHKMPTEIVGVYARVYECILLRYYDIV